MCAPLTELGVNYFKEAKVLLCPHENNFTNTQQVPPTTDLEQGGKNKKRRELWPGASAHLSTGGF